MQRIIPTITLKDIGSLITKAHHHVAINFVETGIREPTFKPVVEGWIVSVEGPLPGLILSTVRHLYRLTSRGTKTSPA